MKTSTTALAFNGIGALVVAGSLAMIVRSTFLPSSEAPCGERYADGVLFGIEAAGGQPMSSAELEGRLAGDDWGVRENFLVVPAGGLEHPGVDVARLRSRVQSHDHSTV